MMKFGKRQALSLAAGTLLVLWAGCSKESSSPKAPSQIPPRKQAMTMPGTSPQASKTSPSTAVPEARTPGTAVPQAKTPPASAVPAIAGAKIAVQPGKGTVPAATFAGSATARAVAAPEPARASALSPAAPGPGMVPKPSLTADSSGATQPDNRAVALAALSSKRPEYDSGGRKDPFIPYYMLEDSKTKRSSFPLLNFKLEELKLTVIIKVGKQNYYAMMQTPDGKGYTVKTGMEIGSGHGRIKEITDQTLKVEEEILEDSQRKKREVVFSLHSPEEGKS